MSGRRTYADVARVKPVAARGVTSNHQGNDEYETMTQRLDDIQDFLRSRSPNPWNNVLNHVANEPLVDAIGGANNRVLPHSVLKLVNNPRMGGNTPIAAPSPPSQKKAPTAQPPPLVALVETHELSQKPEDAGSSRTFSQPRYMMESTSTSRSKDSNEGGSPKEQPLYRMNPPQPPILTRTNAPLFPVHTIQIIPEFQGEHSKRGQFQQKSSGFSGSRRHSRGSSYYVRNNRHEMIGEEGPTVKQHLQQQQRQMKEKERLSQEHKNPSFDRLNAGSPSTSGSNSMRSSHNKLGGSRGRSRRAGMSNMARSNNRGEEIVTNNGQCYIVSQTSLPNPSSQQQQKQMDTLVRSQSMDRCSTSRPPMMPNRNHMPKTNAPYHIQSYPLSTSPPSTSDDANSRGSMELEHGLPADFLDSVDGHLSLDFISGMAQSLEMGPEGDRQFYDSHVYQEQPVPEPFPQQPRAESHDFTERYIPKDFTEEDIFNGHFLEPAPFPEPAREPPLPVKKPQPVEQPPKPPAKPVGQNILADDINSFFNASDEPKTKNDPLLGQTQPKSTEIEPLTVELLEKNDDDTLSCDIPSTSGTNKKSSNDISPGFSLVDWLDDDNLKLDGAMVSEDDFSQIFRDDDGLTTEVNGQEDLLNGCDFSSASILEPEHLDILNDGVETVATPEPPQQLLQEVVLQPPKPHVVQEYGYNDHVATYSQAHDVVTHDVVTSPFVQTTEMSVVTSHSSQQVVDAVGHDVGHNNSMNKKPPPRKNRSSPKSEEERREKAVRSDRRRQEERQLKQRKAEMEAQEKAKLQEEQAQKERETVERVIRKQMEEIAAEQKAAELNQKNQPTTGRSRNRNKNASRSNNNSNTSTPQKNGTVSQPPRMLNIQPRPPNVPATQQGPRYPVQQTQLKDVNFTSAPTSHLLPVSTTRTFYRQTAPHLSARKPQYPVQIATTLSPRITPPIHPPNSAPPPSNISPSTIVAISNNSSIVNALLPQQPPAGLNLPPVSVEEKKRRSPELEALLNAPLKDPNFHRPPQMFTPAPYPQPQMMPSTSSQPIPQLTHHDVTAAMPAPVVEQQFQAPPPVVQQQQQQQHHLQQHQQVQLHQQPQLQQQPLQQQQQQQPEAPQVAIPETPVDQEEYIAHLHSDLLQFQQNPVVVGRLETMEMPYIHADLMEKPYEDPAFDDFMEIFEMEPLGPADPEMLKDPVVSSVVEDTTNYPDELLIQMLIAMSAEELLEKEQSMVEMETSEEELNRDDFFDWIEEINSSPLPDGLSPEEVEQRLCERDWYITAETCLTFMREELRGEEIMYFSEELEVSDKFDDEHYGRKLDLLKENFVNLIYTNAALVDEVSRLSHRVMQSVEERKILCRRLCHHNRNYIRRLQTAKKRKLESEKKKLETKDEEVPLTVAVKIKSSSKTETESRSPSANGSRRKSVDSVKKAAANKNKDLPAGEQAPPKKHGRPRKQKKGVPKKEVSSKKKLMIPLNELPNQPQKKKFKLDSDLLKSIKEIPKLPKIRSRTNTITSIPDDILTPEPAVETAPEVEPEVVEPPVVTVVEEPPPPSQTPEPTTQEDAQSASIDNNQHQTRKSTRISKQTVTPTRRSPSQEVVPAKTGRGRKRKEPADISVDTSLPVRKSSKVDLDSDMPKPTRGRPRGSKNKDKAEVERPPSSVTPDSVTNVEEASPVSTPVSTPTSVRRRGRRPAAADKEPSVVSETGDEEDTSPSKRRRARSNQKSDKDSLQTPTRQSLRKRS